MSVPVGMLAWTENFTGQELISAVQRFENLGYHELWLPELNGREPFATCGYLLAKTTTLRVSSGIANVYVRDADAAAQGRQTLCELSGGRFSLGLGVSHPLLVEPRGHEWKPPVDKMQAYLERIKASHIDAPAPREAGPILVAAHGRGLWRVVAEGADGILTHLQPPQTIRNAREVLGTDKQIHAVVRCVLEEDADRARDLARRSVSFYLQLPAYHRSWAAAGFNEGDWAAGGSDALIDRLCAWGSPDRIRDQLREFEEAGATHIVIVSLHPEEVLNTDTAVLKRWNWDLLEALALRASNGR